MFARIMTLTTVELETVRGGAAAQQDSFGRCGPGNSMQWLLGNIYTPECKAHDAAVRSFRQQGSSYLMAQLKALPQFPAAAGSWFRERFK
jgi:hypothetical protein